MALDGKESIHGWPLSGKEEARQSLIRLTGQDFGYDAEQWRRWMLHGERHKWSQGMLSIWSQR